MDLNGTQGGADALSFSYNVKHTVWADRRLLQSGLFILAENTLQRREMKISDSVLWLLSASLSGCQKQDYFSRLYLCQNTVV